MTRRNFGKGTLSTIATLAIAGTVTLPIAGCSFSVTGMINTVIASVEAILKVAEPNASWVASLEAALAALQTAESTWQAGGAVTIVEDALNTIEAVVAVIPLTAPYAPLIAVLVAGIEAILNYFSPSTSAARSGNKNIYIGRVSLRKPHLFQTQVGAYKEEWNDTARSLGLSKALIS